MRTVVIALLTLSLGGTASAHRLDEYLQATLIGVTRDGIDIEIHLTPGVAVLPVLIPVIDQDRDAYVGRVVREVELRVDGIAAPLLLVDSSFPTLEAMREGLGTIVIKLRTTRTGRHVRFENRHLPQISAYLVNCLAAPSDGLIVSRQERDEGQKSIQFNYAFEMSPAPGSQKSPLALASFWPAAIGLLLIIRMALLIYRAKSSRATP